MTSMEECRLRCVYVDGRPLPRVKILLLRESIARVVVIIGCDYYVFAFKEEAKEFIRQRLGVENFEIRSCPRE
jgi:hypothetical protein